MRQFHHKLVRKFTPYLIVSRGPFSSSLIPPHSTLPPRSFPRRTSSSHSSCAAVTPASASWARRTQTSWGRPTSSQRGTGTRTGSSSSSWASYTFPDPPHWRLHCDSPRRTWCVLSSSFSSFSYESSRPRWRTRIRRKSLSSSSVWSRPHSHFHCWSPSFSFCSS